MILLRSFKRTLFIACGIITATTCAMAQTTPVNTQLLLANPAANDDFLLPSMLNASATQTAPNEIQAPSDVDILTAIFGSGGEKKQANSSFSHTFFPQPETERPDDQPLLTPLPPIPDPPDVQIPPKKKLVVKPSYANKAINNEIQNTNSDFDLPKEMRILFYPNSVALSAPNVMWVKAFAAHVIKDPRLLMVIRISNQDWTLQRARLAMLLQIAIETGISAHQIRVYSSNRSPNSLILGYMDNDQLTKIQPIQDKIKPIKTQKTLSW